MRERILFVLKKRTVYSEYSYAYVNSGLYNSAKFVDNMLVNNGIDSRLVEVNDNNEIDKYVTEHKPTTVIIEALFVVPEKFEVLTRLHPNVRWIIRLHSELSFIANEGIAVEWLREYVKYSNVFIAANSKIFIEGMQHILGESIIYLPNYYPNIYKRDGVIKDRRYVDIGLFGSIRPLKNGLTQAVAAIIYANSENKILRLHINTERVEQRGENPLKNIRALFKDSKHKLIEHKWLNHGDFVDLVSTMDLGLQVSLSETYNIVAADFVMQEIPIVTSEEISFVSGISQVRVEKDVSEIFDAMEWSVILKMIVTKINKIKLKINSYKARRTWIKFFK